MKTKTLTLFTAMTLFAALGITGQSFAQNTQPSSALQTDPKAQAKILDQYGKLPLSFEANNGQTDRRVKFLSRGHGYSLFLTGNQAVIALKKAAPQSDEMKGLPGLQRFEPQKEKPAEGTVVRMELAGANAVPRIVGAEELPGKTNYFIGNDPAKWRTNVPTYAKVKYEGVYPGVDLVYYGNQGQLECDFVVAPGVDPTEIRLKFRGAGTLRIDDKADLVLRADGEQVRLQKPHVYQEANGKRKAVEGRYWIAAANTISFLVADYDRSKPLVIDPVLVYSTYLGGSDLDFGRGIAVDSLGNAYVTGQTGSTNFPTTNPLQPSKKGYQNAFVTKINSAGSALVYSTYLGGSGTEVGFGIAVDSAGNAYVTGNTSSTDFPMMNPLQPTYGGGAQDGFVTKINSAGSALVYSTYLGGSGTDGGYGIAVDSSGNAYVTGQAGSTDFPMMNPLQPTYGGGEDAFVAKFNPTGSALVYSTYLGGSGDEFGLGITVDTTGNAYVTGTTSSTDFPTANPLQTTIHGITDSFVAKLNSAGSALVYSTYLGGSSFETGTGIVADSSGNAYVIGYTDSADFPTMNPLQPTYGGGEDAFVAKFNPTGSALVYSTYLGGSGQDDGYGIAVDSSGNAYVTGITRSPNFPTKDPLQLATSTFEAFVAELNPAGSALVYSTYLGGQDFIVGGGDSQYGFGIAVDSSGNAYVTGTTSTTDFPMMNPLQPTYGGGSYDAFVAKIASAQSDNTAPTTIATPSPGPNGYGWNNTSVTVALNSTDNPGGSGVEQIQFSLSGAENLGLQTVAGNTASVTISAQGITTLTYFATDNAGNVETAKTLTVQIDLTPPVVAVTGVSNGAVYYFNQAPAAGCNTTDALSGVATPASLAVTGGNKHGFGNYTATCSGAMDEAGNTAAPVSVSYTVDGPTLLAALVDRKTGPLNARVWQIIIGNSGPGTAYNAEIASLSLRQTWGAACTPHLVSTLPVTAGNISPLSTATVSVTINFSGCASSAIFRVDGQVSANNGTAVGPILMLSELP